MTNNILASSQKYNLSELILIKKINFISNKNPSILLIHGWGSSHKIWRDCINSLSNKFNIFVIDLPGHGESINYLEDSLESYIEILIKQKLPDRFSIIGWSVGGIIASFLAKKIPERVSNLILISTNLHFLKNKNWSKAMDPFIFENFMKSLKTTSCKKVLDKFQILQTIGVETSRDDLYKTKSLSEQDDFSLSGLINILGWLKNYDLSSIWKDLPMPVLHQYGLSDAIVPIEACEEIKHLYNNHYFQIYKKSSHIPFISEKDKWMEETSKFILSENENYFIDKKNISKSFSKVAQQYDQFAIIQKKIGRKLFDYLLSFYKQKDEILNIHDLGSGTGFFTKDLKNLYPKSIIYELDISLDMLRFSSLKQLTEYRPLNLKSTYQIQADIENLPFSESSSDIIFSNLSLQWCKNQEKVFYGIAKVLKEEGIAVISTLVEGTFDELRVAWGNVDESVHVNNFENSHMMDLNCKKNGLCIVSSNILTYTENFSCVYDLLNSVKRIGAHNMNAGRKKGLLGKDKFNRFIKELENYKSEENTYQLTYKVKFLILKKA